MRVLRRVAAWLGRTVSLWWQSRFSRGVRFLNRVWAEEPEAEIEVSLLEVLADQKLSEKLEERPDLYRVVGWVLHECPDGANMLAPEDEEVPEGATVRDLFYFE